MIAFRQAPCLRGRRRIAGRTLGSMSNAPIWRMGLTQMSTTANLSSRIRNPELAFPKRLASTCLSTLVVLGAGIAGAEPPAEELKANRLAPSAASSQTSSRHPTLPARNIVLSGTKQILPYLRHDDPVDTQLRFANVTDSDAEFSFVIRGADGLPLAMRLAPIETFESGGSLIRYDRPVTDGEWITVPPYNQLTMVTDFEASDRAGTGWMEVTSKPDASISVTAYVSQNDDFGSVSIVEPTEISKHAFVPIPDNFILSEYELVLINPSATEEQNMEIEFRARSSSCDTSISIAPMGQAVLNCATILPCIAGSLGGSIAIQSQDGFSGFLSGSNRPFVTLLTKFVSQSTPTDSYSALEHWSVASGQITFGNVAYSHCLTLSDSTVVGSEHTVHSSKWQTRTGEYEPWSDVPDTDRVGQICPYSPTLPGQYRGAAEISVDGVRGMFASSNVLTVDDEQPRFLFGVLDKSYVAGDAVSEPALPAALGGNLPLTYSLSPSVPGLDFNADTRSLTGTPTTAGTHAMTYTVTDADGDTAELSFALHVTSGSAAGEDTAEYQPLRVWTVSGEGRVTFSVFGSDECITIGNLTVLGAAYTVHTSKWQTRVDANGPWADIPGTTHDGGICAYSPTESGQYRGVAEISVDGTRGKYSSNNILTVP